MSLNKKAPEGAEKNRNRNLMQFLEREEDNVVWLLVSSGLVSGTLNKQTEESEDTIILENALLHQGDLEIQLGKSSVAIDGISCWGNGTPYLKKMK